MGSRTQNSFLIPHHTSLCLFFLNSKKSFSERMNKYNSNIHIREGTSYIKCHNTRSQQYSHSTQLTTQSGFGTRIYMPSPCYIYDYTTHEITFTKFCPKFNRQMIAQGCPARETKQLGVCSSIPHAGRYIFPGVGHPPLWQPTLSTREN